MNIPNIPPMTTPFINKDGHVTEVWYNVLNQLIIQMQENVSNEGYKVPQQSTFNVSALNNTKSIGALLYDEDLHLLKVNINGVFKTVTTS